MSFCLYTLSPNVCTLVYNNYSYSHLQFEISLMNLKTSGIRWRQPYRSPILSTDTLCREAERLVTTAKCTSKTTNSNSVLPRTASNDIQQHVNSANSGDVDIRNLTITLMRTVVLQRSWYKMPGCLVQWKMNKNTHGYMTVRYTQGI
jgi:hypothetical protein